VPTFSVDQAQKAFDEAVTLFGSKLSNGASGAKWLSATKATSITDIIDCVKDARSIYEMRRGSSKVRDSLSRFSERVHHYGNIMDVLVQHHPEYVSLAWGTMKLLFIGSVLTLVVFHTNLTFLKGGGESRTSTHNADERVV
jgi:hypothetical protein